MALIDSVNWHNIECENAKDCHKFDKANIQYCYVVHFLKSRNFSLENMRAFYFTLFVLLAINFGFTMETTIEDPTFLDPGRYYAKSQAKTRRRLKNRTRHNFSNNELPGSFSNSKNKKSSLKYAFLQPQYVAEEDIDTCKTPGSISAFQFMNFALAAATLAGIRI